MSLHVPQQKIPYSDHTIQRIDLPSSNPKTAPTWEEHIKMCNQSTRSIIRSSIRRDTDNLTKNNQRMPYNTDKTESNFKDSVDENGDECLIEPNEKYPININDFDRSSSQESQEENDDYDEHSNRGLRDRDEPPSKRQRLIYDSNYTEAPDCNGENVESTEHI
ncbi:21446_t:CDS:2 [Dentiscutata erythropus]|uniref:21446_t:CDS:1 n=1 Tax=Dentiscutata erythropus TaxID=1348616 RepID=A0A9N8Z2G4_9GLOM|nr:21446_t:CDS:2 [Dentiscutata erythropus]